MNVRKYLKTDHLTLSGWLHARNLEPWPSNDLPRYGYVATENDKPIAMGFLRWVEVKNGMIDALCTDPSAEPHKRSDAIDSVVVRIISEAKKLGLTGLICFSEDGNTLERSKKFGFKDCPEKKIIGLRL